MTEQTTMSFTSSTEPTKVKSVVPKHRQNLLKWNGWGYNDSAFRVNEKDIIVFTGNRYSIGNTELPYFTRWVKDVFDIDVTMKDAVHNQPQTFPKPVLNDEFVNSVKRLDIEHSIEGMDRLMRAHGHALREIFHLREGGLKKIPDMVIWPRSHDDVEKIVRLCCEHDVVCIPFGGGTSVSGAANCPLREHRMIVALDTSQMNRILWIDKENLLACCESGIVGQDLERELRLHDLTSGHEPDSYEFSSLGGWVATRASGMKKNVYGNIEDLVVRVRMVTGRSTEPVITLERGSQVPRLSCGPDFNHIILGSEGTLGVVTEVVIKVRPVPKIVKYGSAVFPNFECGVRALREVAKQRCQPASIRLMDNEQFKFGQALRPVPGWGGLVLQGLKQAYITRIKGFNWDTLCVVTLLFEGFSATEVAAQERKIYDIIKKYQGVPSGETNGERGYTLTFVIAYIRDLGLDYGVLSESFETSVSWNRATSLCRNVKSRITRELQVRGIRWFLISCRVTQTYDSGCCIYFYMGFNYIGLKDPVGTYEEIEKAAREEIMANGGSLSHHHGVGKMRAEFYPQAVGEAGVDLYRATKNHLDPKNVFAAGNLDADLKAKL